MLVVLNVFFSCFVAVCPPGKVADRGSDKSRERKICQIAIILKWHKIIIFF